MVNIETLRGFGRRQDNCDTDRGRRRGPGDDQAGGIDAALRRKLVSVSKTTWIAASVLCGLVAVPLVYYSGILTTTASARDRSVFTFGDLATHPDRGAALDTALTHTVADSLLEPPALAHPDFQVLTVSAGDTLMGLLTGADIDSRDAHNAIVALSDLYDPRRLQIGQELTVTFGQDDDSVQFSSLTLRPDVDRTVVVSRSDDGFAAAEIENRLETRLAAGSGVIESSLYAATNGAGVPDQILIDLMRVYSYDVDFQRDIQAGDGFRVLFEQEFDPEGTLARNGAVLFATLILDGQEKPIYRFETDDGVVDYYDRDGQSVRRALMRTPIDGARISSNFGMRRHPVLGYNKMHRGTDFAAPSGTPIYASGDGVIDFIGRNGGYGNFIRIRHNSSLGSAYAHMKGFAKGLNRGDRVRQGQVIGYVGTTGRSTGPHLHYEVLVDSQQVNPLSVDLPTGRTLEGTELAEFRDTVGAIDRHYRTLIDESLVASRP